MVIVHFRDVAMYRLAVMLVLLVSGFAQAATVQNADFETNDLAGWTTIGQVGVQADEVQSGTYSAWLGTVDFDNDNINDYTNAASVNGNTANGISQSILVHTPAFTAIQVYYNFTTQDYDIYDDPGFQIFVDGTAVVTERAGDLSPADDGDIDSTGWLMFEIDLTGRVGDTVDLEIYAGNTDDELFQSWAYVEVANVIPIPPALVLFPSALLALGWVRRRSS